MTKISFPVDAFDESLCRFEGISTTVWADLDCCVGYYVFREDLRLMCDELNITSCLKLNFRQSKLTSLVREVEKQNDKRLNRARDDFAKLQGFDTWHPDIINKCGLDVMYITLWMAANTKIIQIPDKKFLIMADSLEVPDDQEELYLMVKLAI